MPSTIFDSAGLAFVAYAQVAADGTSVSTALANSGVTTTKVGGGSYLVILSTALAEDPSSRLSFVQVKMTTGLIVAPRFAMTFPGPGQEASQVLVNVYDISGTPSDAEFDVLILRTVLPPATP